MELCTPCGRPLTAAGIITPVEEPNHRLLYKTPAARVQRRRSSSMELCTPHMTWGSCFETTYMTGKGRDSCFETPCMTGKGRDGCFETSYATKVVVEREVTGLDKVLKKMKLETEEEGGTADRNVGNGQI